MAWGDSRQRLELYRQGLNDREIAERVGVSTVAIAQWRHRRGLPPNKHKRPDIPTTGNIIEYQKRGGVPIEKVLTPEQCKDMRRFLGYLVEYADTVASKKKQPDVGKFIIAYREVFHDLPEKEVYVK